jgi:hypothetical protein
MADAELKVRIDAEIKGFSTALKQGERELSGFSTKVNSELNKTAAAAAAASAKLGGSVAQGTDRAAFALTNLGRVAQDAPFGFIGIQNNIPPLIESFQRLKQTTGTTGGALKALGSSLVGSGGLLFGVSLVTSALTVLAQNPEQVAGALNYLAGVTDKTTESQKKYNEAINESLGSAKVEISNLESLISIARNETLSRNARLEALKKVKAEYPEQLEFLRLENINSKEAAKAIDILSNSLLRKAKIQAVEKLLGEAFVKQLESTTKSAVQQASTLSKVVGAGLGAAGIKNFVVLQNGLENQSKAFKEAGTEINTYSAILKKLNTEEANAGTLFDDKTKKPKKETEFFRGEQFVAKPSQNELDKFLEAYKKTALELNKTPLVPFPQIAERLAIINQDLINFNQQASDIINNSLVNTFAGIGGAIGQALTSGANIGQALGQTLLQSIGSVLGQLGQMAIATGVAILKIKLSLKTFNPYAAIAGGVALLALSGVVRSKAAKLGGSGGGSSGFGGGGSASPTPAFSTSTAGSSGVSGSDFGGGSVVFQISGANLIGVLNRAGQKLQRYGG